MNSGVFLSVRLVFAFIFLCVFGAFLVSCSEKGAVPHPAGSETGEPGEFLESLGVEPLQASKPVTRPLPASGGGGFEITVLEDEGAIPAKNIRVIENALPGGGINLVFEAEGAPVSTSAMIEISFDKERFTPAEWTPGGFFGRGGDTPQSLARGEAFAESDSFIGLAASSPGELGIGVFRIHPDEQGGVSGDGVIASVTFNAGEFGTSAATVERELAQSAPEPEYFWDFDYGVVFPAGDPDDPYLNVLHDPMLPGDGNGDFEVTIADVAAIARYYLEPVDWGSAKKLPRPKSPSDSYTVTGDLDRSGEVNMADVAVVALYYNRLYLPNDLAYRETGGNWYFISEEHTGVPGEEFFSPPSYRLLSMKKVDYRPDIYEYGMRYLSQSSGEQGVLPYTSWPLTIFLDDAILRNVSYDPVSERFDLTINYPDWNDDGEVNIADVAFISTHYPYNLTDQELSLFATEAYWEDLRELSDVDNDGVASLSPIIEGMGIATLVAWHYLSAFESIRLDYYDTVGANQPIATVIRRYPYPGMDKPEIEYSFREELQFYYCIGEAPFEAVEVKVSMRMSGEIKPAFTWPVRFAVNQGA